MFRLRDKRQAEHSPDEQGKRVRVDEMALVPWSGPSGEKRSLGVDDGEHQKKQCIGERSEQQLSLPPPLPDDGDEILWCELVENESEVLADWTAEIEDLQEVTTEQLVQGAAKKGNEKGSNVHEKSLIWAAKDTEWKKLVGKGAVRILSGVSAEKAKAQFGDRFIPSRFVVTRSGPEEFKARWCLRGYLDPDVMELVGSGATQSPTVSQLGRVLSCQMIVSNGWDLQLGDVREAFLEADALDRKKGSLYSSLPPGGIPGVPDGSVILMLGKIYGLNDASQRWWKKFDAVMTFIGFTRSTFDVCVCAQERWWEPWRYFVCSC